ncbi:flagellar biosynthesis protein FlhA [Leptospira borgpetersenii]|uniref:Flagellar biosynthesis protein FlhA n=2 Tax=Leptospira borgpetersenii serovar Hardjo-bovis TaxID=338217 RepID=Q04SD6_LEPBJ|nr:flagellar biosynthesis protein FlhA [Leptospira borgpetersenii]ABJ76184.1 Endoflagellar biosynthesis protein [Leptospira borgpetersenii serovar Hardjo-bovis str. JB197]ABJ79281.1 Endoflagellar biosynthesis protein [Leptospira borgpetersenii serovar Hardjo-bovis str. L550]AMX58593.1 endoflagellar biosynthesis protein [Leptospira borgpetersenii serovar Hardjo]AMX61847.1 endoflagellar biosynthesis protein [Leptospira borgpetersenii serovar Hardjo]AMX65091.1 endoflagellar biosynthesis protein [
MEKKWWNQSDVILGVGAVAIVAMLVIPLPGLILDILIIVSLAIGLLVLLTSLSVNEPADFSIFPSLLLITTLYRLALNVSTTRQILSKGPAMNSHVIDAFGSFIIGSESGLSKYVVGFIIFIILVLVQILVITKGATRISEVAARFTLDALPGKQMAIDMELSSGNINEEEAKKRRKRIEAEVDFYGSMDGASKFVQGDVRAGLIITAINLLGGVIIGSSIRGESFTQAIETYGKFTIGDGLVSQIPALLTTVATGIIVTRSGSESDLATQFKSQLFSNSKVLYVVAGSLGFSAFIPGLPFIPLVILSAGIAYLGYSLEQTVKEQLESIEKKEKESGQDRKPKDFYEELRTDPIEIEVGYHLIPLVDTSQGGALLDQISNLRKKFAQDNGVVIPPVRILDNLDLNPDTYSIKINGTEVGISTVKPDKLMALNTSPGTAESIQGEDFLEPSFGQKAKWISSEDKSEAEAKGYTVVDASTVVVTHLKELLATHASTLLGREEVKKLLDHYKTSYPTLIGELDADKPGNLGIIQQVLQNLLREGLGIRNLVPILESIANNLSKYQNPYILTELVRQSVARTVVKDYLSIDGKLRVITLESRILDRLNKSITQDRIENRDVLSLAPDFYKKLIDSVAELYRNFRMEGKFPIFVVNRDVRLPFSYLLAKEFPPRNFGVLAYEEIHSSVDSVIEAELKLPQTQTVGVEEEA